MMMMRNGSGIIPGYCTKKVSVTGVQWATTVALDRTGVVGEDKKHAGTYRMCE